jgi:hypothetical protein
MKHHLFILCLLPLFVQAIDRDQIDKMLTAAVTAQSNAYIEARATITNLGTNALPMLAQAGNDATLSWQQRLVARIGYERIERTHAIETLRSRDWRKYPGYDPRWERSMVGPGVKMFELVVPVLTKEGLWYYYIEVTWKKTGELALSPLMNINDLWSQWCRLALAGRPEEEYLFRAMEERLDKDVNLQEPDAIKLYKLLVNTKKSDAVPILIQRYDAYNRREASGLELYPGAKAESYVGLFKPILSFADSRHAEILEKFVADHAALADLKPRLADVRAKLAPAAKADPPFRTGGFRDVTQTNK